MNWRRVVRVLAPLAVIATVCVLELATSKQTVVLGLVATAPLLAANLVEPRLTAIYAAIARTVRSSRCDAWRRQP